VVEREPSTASPVEVEVGDALRRVAAEEVGLKRLEVVVGAQRRFEAVVKAAGAVEAVEG
jgi:hypothetical protein